MGCWRLYFCMGLLHLGCIINREVHVAALLRWLLTQVSLYKQLCGCIILHHPILYLS